MLSKSPIPLRLTPSWHQARPPAWFAPSGWRLLGAVALMVISLAGCLTPRSTKQTANIRGLTAREAEQLEAIHNPDWHYPLRPQEKEQTPLALAETAELMCQQGDYEQAIYNYSRILQQSPEQHDIRYKLAIALSLHGNLEAAKRELAQVLIHQPDHAGAHEALGIIHLQENNLAEAQQEFRTVLSLTPERVEARMLLGEALLRAKNYTQALRECQAALAKAPQNARNMSNIGWIYYQLKRSDDAVLWLQKARRLKPHDPRTNQRLGMVLAAQKKYNEALEAFRQGGDEAQAFNNIGVFYYLEGRYEEAARCFQKALDLRPTYYEEAKANLDKALAHIRGVPHNQAEQIAAPLIGQPSARALPQTPPEE